MKPGILALLLAMLVISTGSGSEVREEWRRGVDGEVLQIVTDGRGGCALASIVTDEVYRVVWYHKTGRLLFDSGRLDSLLPLGSMAGPIHECTARQLVFTGTYYLPYLIQVKRNGTLLPAFALGGFVIGSPYELSPPAGLPTSRVSDKKGLFVINVETNTAVQTLIRYSFN